MFLRLLILLLEDPVEFEYLAVLFFDNQLKLLVARELILSKAEFRFDELVCVGEVRDRQ